MADEMMEYYQNLHIVFAKFKEDKLIDINQKEKLMFGLANKVDKTPKGQPFGYNWARLTLLCSGLHAKPTCSWSPYVLWDVNTVCVWKEDAILPGTAVIYKNCGKFKYDASSEKNLILHEFDTSLGPQLQSLTLWKPPQLKQQRKPTPQAAASKKNHSLESVSYTHLTLPTKRIV